MFLAAVVGEGERALAAGAVVGLVARGLALAVLAMAALLLALSAVVRAKAGRLRSSNCAAVEAEFVELTLASGVAKRGLPALRAALDTAGVALTTGVAVACMVTSASEGDDTTDTTEVLGLDNAESTGKSCEESTGAVGLVVVGEAGGERATVA